MTDVLDVVVPALGTGEGVFAFELAAAETAALDALATRLGISTTAIWRATWALTLARLAGDATSGDLESWLRGSYAATQALWDDHAAPSEDGAALIWRATVRGAAARFTQTRIDVASVARLGEVLHVVLAQVLAGAKLEAISPLAAAERTLVVETWNQTAVLYRPEATVHALFREQAAANPARIALAWDGGKLTYAELDRWSDALAERLIAAGVASDQPVALILERSPEAVVAALAILKAGGAYLPLDPDYPAERITFAIADAGANVLVTSRAHTALAAFASTTIFVDDAARDASGVTPRIERATPRTRAYVMYTSGSTGTPKGVQIEHRSIIRLVGRPAYVELSPDTKFLHAAPLGFDASTLELWGPLLHGGTVVVYADPVPTGRGLARSIAAHGVTTMWLTSALFNSIVDEDPRLFSGVRQLFTGGETLSPSHVKRALAALPATELVNGYGPTECTTFTTTWRIARDWNFEQALPIGGPIADTQLYVLDRSGQPVPVGIVGELFVGGLGVARGYLARPELDRERFVADTFANNGERLYRTGDQVRWRSDGTLDFLGRVDNQVKLRGFRIELGEIEARLGALPGVTSCAVMIRSDGPLGKRLVAYVVGDATPPALRTQLGNVLPEFMVPATFVMLDALPVTANGKLDRAKLPAPTTARPELAQPYRAPASEREETICRAFAAVLGIDQVGALDGFFELGGNSLLSLRLLTRMREAGLPDISPAIFFAAPTPAALAKAIDAPAPTVKTTRHRHTDEPIAIIGFAGRFPGATDVAAFWDNLCAGRESIKIFAPGELDPSIPAALRNDPAYVPARGVLEGVELFDAPFFGISPLEAQLMDPQHRHFLEVAWQALEHSGYVPETAPGPVGVFGGMYNATYLQRHLVPRPDVSGRLGELALMLGNEKDYVTTRVAHKLGLTGPAVSIHTACSTSLVASAMAMDSLRNGGCDLALAGGVAITCPPNSGHLYQDGSMASPDGHTRTFDVSAGGTVFSDGVAIVVLRRLSDAIAAGDQIYAVMLGAAVNNDGSERASFTAPSPEGQAAVIAAAHDAAGIDARTLSYIEAHGTATPLGDPIEIEGLTRAFSRHTQERQFCAIGSLKSNVGHMVIAAGAASLIKTSLALHTKQLPPSINFSGPTPRIDFSRTPFRVQAQLSPWPESAGPRRAGVSSFGFGGTNAHVVLEEAPPAVRSTPSPRAAEVLLVSARTAPALADACTNLAGFLATTDQPLADTAHTLQTGRKGFNHRRWIVATSAAEGARLITAPDPNRTGARELGAELPDLGFLCPGQGSQYARMGYGLYHSEPAFRAAYDECCLLIQDHTGSDPREIFFSKDPQALVPTSQTQPAIFTLEYSLAKLWMSWGVKPTALIGHSVGEWVCAALAEIMSLGDALGLVVERGRRMQALPAGSMLSVRLPAAELEPKLPAGVVIAAENGPGLCVASGPSDLIAKLEAELTAANVAARKLVTSHAFHSSMMEPVIEPLAAKIAAVKLSPPKIRIMSTVTARWMTDADATSTRYWAEHLRLPVKFAPAAAALLAESKRVLIEIGPRATLSALARQAAPGKRALPPAIPSTADAAEREPEAIAAALGQIWSLGAVIDWAGYRSTERRRRLAMPTYPFQRVRHWVDAPSITAAPVVVPTAPALVALPVPAPEIPAMSNVPVDRRPRLIASICELVEEVSGLDVTTSDPATPWLELGLDSLTLTQLALQVQRTHNIKVTFRQVMENFPTIAALAGMLDEQLAPDVAAAPVAAAPVIAIAAPVHAAPAAGGDYVRQVIDQQLAVMAQQLALLTGGAMPQPAPVVAAPKPVAVAAPAPAPAKNEDEPAAGPQTYDVKKAFGAIARIHTAVDELTPQQRSRLDALIARYTKRTRKSKDYTIEHRDHMADPRVVNGFRPLTKELTYQIVIERSRGSKLWDIDGNEYVDVLQGFGMSMFGWQPDFLREAIHKQVDLGYEIGPQHVLAGETAKLFCDVTGADRAAFCNTGSEAVMGCMRIARTVTGRTLIAVFTGAYHGIFDEVIVRGTRKLKSIPAAPGIMPSTVQNVIVLDYGTPESMEILKSRAHELAAIVVEPVQSRRPDFQPVEFLRELRKLTQDNGIVFVFDEVVTGFRSHPRGAQGLFDIKADLASYGKVVGGGFSVGVIAGKREFMDALDGGDWRYGDNSIPTVGVTYFAGTFVRHPLALAAAKAVLLRIKAGGPELQQRLTAKTAAMVAEINAFMVEIGAPFKLNTFISLWRNAFTEDLPYNDILYPMIRDRGIHILDNFPCFLTTEHSDADIRKIIEVYKAAAQEMQASGFWPVRANKIQVVEAGVREAPSTEPQREVWLADKLGTGASLAYNESISLHLRGELDVGALRTAIRALPERHDALRGSFADDGTTLRTAATLELEVPLREAGELDAIVARHVGEPFDLEHGPLIRAELVKLDADHHVLVFTGHHIVLDGWSYWVIVKDLAALYAIATGARTTPLPPAPSYVDYAIDIASRAASPEVRANEAWWIERFAAGVPALDLPTDRARPAIRTTTAGREDFMLPAELLAGVKKLGAKLGASAFATLLAGFDTLLHRITGATDLVVGVPAAGQAAAGLETLVGHCVNMLPLRNQIQRTDTFAQHVAASRATMLDAYDHQEVTFGRVLQMLPIARDPSRLPLISVMFNIDQALSGEGHGMPGITLELMSNARTHETFELFVNAVDTGNGMRLECQYNSDLFDGATIRRWMAAFEVLLRAAVTDPNTPIGKLPLLGEDDRRQLAVWNRTELDYPRGSRIEDLVFETTRRAPDRVAIKSRGKQLTYAQLGARAHAIAAALRAANVRPGDRVGLLVERDIDLVPAVIGALAAGAAYVPLDPAFPTERLRFMIEDAGVRAIVTSKAVAAGSAAVIGSVKTVLLDDIPASAPAAASGGSAEDTAYLIYTSGSTGKPKGVRVPHRAVVNFLAGMRATPGFKETDKLVAVTTLSFDIAVLELMLPIATGAEIILATRDEATDGEALRTLVEPATVMQATPATWRLLIEAGWKGSPKFRALCGGEPLPSDVAAALLARTGELWNMYGPTETTVWSTCARVIAGKPISIGQPIANTKIHVLDADFGALPIGVVGELFIGGDGVTQGYHERPELTAEKFVADPSSLDRSAKMYRTGDLGRWRSDGTIECLGRTDFQVKVRGYRIELGEIEAALSRHPAIVQAAVTTREDRPGDVRLIGYVVAREGMPSDDVLRAHLAQTLPDYMIPARFVSLAQMPLTGSGKVDRKALPAPSGPATANQGEAVAPRTPTEEIVARAYMEALALPRLSVLDDFFALGGHSLLVAQMTTKLSRTLGRSVPMRAGFEHPTVASLATYLDGAKIREVDALPTIPHRTTNAPAPLSLMQQRVWYLEQLQLGKTVFHVPSAHRLEGALDLAALGRAFANLVARQPVMRTAIGTVGDAPAQILVDDLDAKIPFEDLSAMSPGDRDVELMRRIEADIAQPFDLARAPLWRVKLYKLAPEHHVLYFMPHHIIWDGWSFDIFYDEMAALYAAELAGAPSDRAPLKITYGDFSAWHRDWMAGPELARQLEQWRQKLAGAPDALDLPVDRQRPPMQSGEGQTEWLKLPAQTTAALRSVGLREGATLFMTLLGAWSALLHQLTRQPELVVGTPVRGRNLPELEGVAGFFVNALPLRIRVDSDATFLELLRQIRAETVEAFGAQDVPFEHLVRVLDLKRDESRFPIYQAFFSYQDARQRLSKWGNLDHHNVPVFQPSAAQDVALWFLENVDGVVGGLNYNTDIIDPDTAARWRRRYLALVEAIAAHPEKPLRDLLAITTEERAQLAEWNKTAKPLAANANLTELFAQLGKHGAKPAIRHLETTTTYAELAAERDRVAAALAARGVGPGDVVGLLVERTPFMLAALLGTLATGATYLPLDPNFPSSRLAFMLSDADAKIVITDVADTAELGVDAAKLLRPEAIRSVTSVPPKLSSAPDSAAYLIYTSGSTGKPKGVRVPHRAVVNFLTAMRERPGLAASDRLVAVTTLSFDIAVLELMLPLVAGAEIVLATREQATDGNALRTLLERHKATVMQATPATWRMLIEAGWRGGGAFKALCGGEALPPELAEGLLQRTGALWNMYGPTETTVWSTCGRVEAGRGGVTIGTPIDNTEIWILDDRGELAPVGVPGELCIGGDGVALGYHAREELTAEKFISDRYSGRKHGRIYRTGDLARWRADGEIVHLGRTDFQVKVRGYRIELGEIEVALARHHQLAEAVVVAQPGPGGEQRLVAYMVPRSTSSVPQPTALREHLRAALPDYMIPAVFVTLDKLPLTPNGKVDRRALPAPEAQAAEPSASYRGPRTHAEQVVATVWRELLSIERISIADNFLDLGGHSLLIMQAIAKLEARTGKRISPRAFIFQTLEQIAREYDVKTDAPKPPPTPPPAGRLGRWLSSLIPGKN